MKKLITSALILSVSLSAFAEGSSAGWSFKPGERNPNEGFFAKTHVPFVDDITADQDPAKMKLSKSQKHQALAWGLSQSQEKRYTMLMQNQSGFFLSPKNGEHWSPVQVLGINARSDKERKHFADLAAQQQLQYLGKQLAFVQAQSSAYGSLMQQINLKPIDINQIDMKKFSPYNYEPLKLNSGDHFNLFIKTGEPVRTIMAYLLGKVGKANHLNIYFIGKINDAGIQEWARSQNIPPAMVNSGVITLNFNKGRFENMNITKPTPVLTLSTATSQKFVNIGKL
tara:strand:- start:5278 stop:6126 length:849 start_codon:yes stop_codon:yes gene_type:complete